MTNKKFDRNKTVRLATTGILTAIVVVFQFIGASIKFGTFSVSLVLIPIVIGAALGGKYVSTWLGFVFGVVVLCRWAECRCNISGAISSAMYIVSVWAVLHVLVQLRPQCPDGAP